MYFKTVPLDRTVRFVVVVVVVVFSFNKNPSHNDKYATCNPPLHIHVYLATIIQVLLCLYLQHVMYSFCMLALFPGIQ